MSAFTLEPDEDKQTLHKWLHEFVADVIRPAVAEWDEREKTFWPIIQEAAKAGIYSTGPASLRLSLSGIPPA